MIDSIYYLRFLKKIGYYSAFILLNKISERDHHRLHYALTNLK